MDVSAGAVTVATGKVLNVTTAVFDHADAPVLSDPPVVAEPHDRTRMVTATFPAYVDAGIVYELVPDVTFPVLDQVVPPLVE